MSTSRSVGKVKVVEPDRELRAFMESILADASELVDSGEAKGMILITVLDDCKTSYAHAGVETAEFIGHLFRLITDLSRGDD